MLPLRIVQYFQFVLPQRSTAESRWVGNGEAGIQAATRKGQGAFMHIKYKII